MSALVEHIIAARDGLKLVKDWRVPPALDALADAANGLYEREKVIRALLGHSLSHYGSVIDDTSSVGAAQAAARAMLSTAPAPTAPDPQDEHNPSPASASAGDGEKAQLLESLARCAGLEPLSAPTVGEGWRLVPDTPTEAMVDIGREVIMDDRMPTKGRRLPKAQVAVNVYAAMLSASPAPTDALMVQRTKEHYAPAPTDATSQDHKETSSPLLSLNREEG